MGIGRMLETARRHVWLLASAVVIGLALAFLVAFSVQAEPGMGIKGLSAQRRSWTTYQASVNLVIDQAGFGLGRSGTSVDNLARVAPTYAYMATSDAVMTRVEQSYGEIDEEVVGIPVQSSPVIQITVKGSDEMRVQDIAELTAVEFIAYIEEVQTENDIPEDERIVVRALGEPAKPEALSSREVEIAAILFMLPVLGAFALATMIEGSRRRREQQGDSSMGAASQCATETNESKGAGPSESQESASVDPWPWETGESAQ